MRLPKLRAVTAGALLVTLGYVCASRIYAESPTMWVANPFAAQENTAASPLTGTWNMNVTDKDGERRQSTLELQQTDAKLTGRFTGSRGTFKIEGAVQGDQVSFTLEAPMGHHVGFKGIVKSNGLSGTNDRGGTWTATRL
jgi:hypothetical protein